MRALIHTSQQPRCIRGRNFACIFFVVVCMWGAHQEARSEFIRPALLIYLTEKNHKKEERRKKKEECKFFRFFEVDVTRAFVHARRKPRCVRGRKFLFVCMWRRTRRPDLNLFGQCFLIYYNERNRRIKKQANEGATAQGGS